MLIAEHADQFLWWPHMFRHNHAHEYDVTNLTSLMQQNREFAQVGGLELWHDQHFWRV